MVDSSQETSQRGLGQAEASRRLQQDGANELPTQRRRSDWQVLLDVVREPMLALLIAGAAIYGLVGEPMDAAALATAATLVILLTFYQAHRAERSLHALRELTDPRALVLRDGRRERIVSRDVVRGDWLIVQEGDRIAADGIVRVADALQVDESLLTGESLPVGKTVDVVQADANDHDRSNRVYAGTLVVSGRGEVEISATGPRTELGGIGKALRDIVEPIGGLQAEIRTAVRWFGSIGFALCALLVGVYSVIHGDPMTGLLAGIALGMAVIPEEYPVVATVLFAFGGHRLARQGVLTRQPKAIETLGSVTVLCVDKTGTLTENRLRIECVVTSRGDSDHDTIRSVPLAQDVLFCAARASDALGADPIDRAVFDLASLATEASDLDQQFSTPAIPVSTPMARGRWYTNPSGSAIAFVKGAPETLLAQANDDASVRQYWLTAAARHAAAGKRVLAVGRSSRGIPRPTSLTNDLPACLDIVGLLVFADPVRAGVPQALAECRSAGIRVLLVTGDHVDTARRIAAEAGLDTDGGTLTGDQLDRMTDGEIDLSLPTLRVCARVRPEHKLRLVQRLQANGAVVGMTGDGVNDAPALRAAHVGIALGGRGTDVAREAADLILTDDRFETIVAGIREGRRIFVNLQNAVTYIAAVHVPTAGLTVLAAMLGLPPLLLPIHIACLELLIDPACTLVFEAEEPPDNLMTVAPRKRRLFDRRLVRAGLLQGALVLLAVAAIMIVGQLRDLGMDELRSLIFVAIVVANGALLAVNQTHRRVPVGGVAKSNYWLWGIVAAGTVFAVVATEVPPLARIFHLTSLSGTAWLVLVVIVILLFVAMKNLQIFRAREV